MEIKEILSAQKKFTDKSIIVNGWVKNRRGSKNVFFISLNDGSTIENLQVVCESESINEEVVKQITTGSCLSVSGLLKTSYGSKQAVEVLANKILILGKADADKYPLQPKKHSLEFLRENAHLRFRTNTFSSVFRIRHSLTFAIHKFFNKNGFISLHTPIITSADAEGAGEMFKVTNYNLNNIPLSANGEVDYSKDFFGQKTSLTVSGQLEAELGALGLGKVYTFGPTFRAENSNTSRHLAEFWMIEPEVAFADLKENIDLAEKMLKYCINYCLENNKLDLEFLEMRLKNEESQLKKELRSESSLLERLKFVVDNEFKRLSYTEAIKILLNSKANKKRSLVFKYPALETIYSQSMKDI